MRKYWGGGGTPPTMLELQPEFVTSGFQRPDLLIFYPIVNKLYIIELIFCHLK